MFLTSYRSDPSQKESGRSLGPKRKTLNKRPGDNGNRDRHLKTFTEGTPASTSLVTAYKKAL